MPFQNVVNTFPSPAVEGDFASENPRQSMVVGDSQLLVGVGGVTVGRFAWADANGFVTNAPTGGTAPYRMGFCARSGQNYAFFQTWLEGSTLLIPEGNVITLHTNADVWVRTTVAAAVVGKKAFASTTDGTIQPGTAGATIAGYVETPWYFVTAAPIGQLAMLSQGG